MSFENFLDSFFGEIAKDDFYGGKSLTSYLSRPAAERSGDEANIVDNKVVDYELGTYQGACAGYLGSLNLEVALGKQRVWLLGLKATRQKGLGGITNLPGQSLTIARQL